MNTLKVFACMLLICGIICVDLFAWGDCMNDIDTRIEELKQKKANVN